MMGSTTSGGTTLAERPVEDDFALDVRVVVAAHPVGKLMCNSGDGCGNTCAGGASACNSYVGDPF